MRQKFAWTEDIPESLEKVKPKVKRLWVRGDLQACLAQPCLAVVGARKMTSYGEQVVERLVRPAAAAGVTIVSGFMYGVDSAAHRAALDVGGRTVAVFGSGLDQVTPAGNERLYSDILKAGGAVVSEYDLQEKAQRWMFPQRNRIVAGLARATLVVEGGEKSGTLITARLTRGQGKKVLAVPGPITQVTSVGTNRLIREGKARVVTSAEEVMKELGFKKGLSLFGKDSPYKDSPLTLESKIIKELEREGMDIDELSRRLKIGVAELGTKLSMMQISGLVAERQGKYYNSNDK